MDLRAHPDWRMLLRLLLAQRLELNAVEAALLDVGSLTSAHLEEIRSQAADTAKAWSQEDDDDILALVRIHSLPHAGVRIPPPADRD